jgi:hypothetical protein
MTDAEEREAALRYHDEAIIEASRVKQMGFAELAKWMRKNADAALKWAARPNLPTSKALKLLCAKSKRVF